jgi:hypothetical protein
MEYHSLDLGRRVVELLAEHGLTTVLDEKTQHGHGFLFATRQTGSISRRSSTGVGVA